MLQKNTSRVSTIPFLALCFTKAYNCFLSALRVGKHKNMKDLEPETKIAQRISVNNPGTPSL